MTSLSETQQLALAYLAGKSPNYVSPTEVGREVGKQLGREGRHSSFGTPLCTKLVCAGLAVRNERGWYALMPEGGVVEQAQEPAANVTKEGIEVVPGQLWRDLDKRQHGRQCKVVEVNGGRAKMRFYSRGREGGETTISIRRMHKHSTGWELVSQ